MKNNISKRFISSALIIIAIMIITVFGACGKEINPIYANGETNTANSNESTAQSQQATQNSNAANSQTTAEEQTTIPSDSEWKKAYKDYISSLDETAFSEFTLIYLDDDDIPELYVIGSYEAAGEIVVTYADGKAADFELPRLYGVKYSERSGNLVSFNGNMGYYPVEHVVLENGKFTVVDTGLKQEKDYDEDTDTYTYTYEINEKEVSEKVFNDTMNGWLTEENRMIPNDSEIYNKTEILEKLS